MDEELKTKMDKIEERLKKHREFINKVEDIKTNIEKLIYYKLITENRANELKDIEFRKLEWDLYDRSTSEIQENDVFVDVDKIVGTWHPSYSNLSLFDAVNGLKKFNDVLFNFIMDPEYYMSDSTRTDSLKKIHLVYDQSNDEYYIDGDANNRLIMIKAIELEKVLANSIEIVNKK